MGQFAAGRPWYSATLHYQVLLNPATAHALTLAHILQMRRTTNLILIGLLGLSMTSCTWLINLIIANNSDKDIFVRYLIPADSVDNQFFKSPKTYKYDEQLLKLYRLNESKRPKDIPTDSRIIMETKELEIKLAPGQAVHVGVYASFQSRQEIISKNDLKVLILNDSTLTSKLTNDFFRHWKNIRTDLLEIK